MTDREKLVELLQKYEKELCGMIVSYEKAAEWLVSKGVTVREPQKPLTVEAMKELWEKRNSEIVWLEDCTGMTLDVRIWTINTQEVWFEKDINEICAPLSTHGRKWRCWIERPTDEEREAAEWE